MVVVKFISYYVLFIVLITQNLPKATCSRPVTNEDIKDVLLSVIHMLHGTQDKLERHEMREKQLGEIVKRALGGLEKRHRGLEPIKGLLERLDERLAGVETVLMQNEERQRLQNLVTNSTVENLVQSIETLNEKLSSIEEGTTAKTGDGGANLNEIKELKTLASELTKKIDKQQNEIQRIGKTTDTLVTFLTERSGKVTADLNKYGEKLLDIHSKLNSAIPSAELTSISYKEPVEGDSLNNSLIATSLESQRQLLETISYDVRLNTLSIEKLATLKDVTSLTNDTLHVLQNVKFDLHETSSRQFDEIKGQITDLDTNLNTSFLTLNDISTNVYDGIGKSYEQLRNEIQALSKIEKVMIQTADNALDIKKRLEYGVHQILLEVGDLVKVQGNNLNGTVNKRFDDIELTILDNQSGALANLTTKFETEMSQVWRQIGIMYQQVTASNTALDRLQAQTETYVNGSLTTMDSMEGKVGKINTRMAEVDENLNFLLGRLSLVTHDFNQIKIGLGDALDNIRGSFITVQNKVKDVGPGPHKIPDAENEVESNLP
ncbi:uncharacterized protein LOC123301572 [Chrysoperla carnea]|uniref:uncharacterized protein LOC123301572 n=1 Tax=Chrysoperla carnea TaxID=189513 RepID=UPI001D05F1A0|nr:uncharacterized protein LOC123301572 [Chrysoperla carnea]